MNVNGLAGSIELYLGEDVLTDRAGRMERVQWKGWIDGVSAYQGEVLHKKEIQQRFDEKLARCENDPALIKTTDWSGIEAILAAIRMAFNWSEL